MGNYNYLTANIYNTRIDEVANYLMQVSSKYWHPNYFEENEGFLESSDFSSISYIIEENKVQLKESVKWASYDYGHEKTPSFRAIEEVAKVMGNSDIEIFSEFGCKAIKEARISLEEEVLKIINKKIGKDISKMNYDEIFSDETVKKVLEEMEIEPTFVYKKQYEPVERKTVSLEEMKKNPVFATWGKLYLDISKNNGISQKEFFDAVNNLRKYSFLDCSTNIKHKLVYVNAVNLLSRAKKKFEDLTIEDYVKYTAPTGGIFEKYIDTYKYGLKKITAEENIELSKEVADYNKKYYSVNKMAKVINSIANFGTCKQLNTKDSKNVIFENEVGCFEKYYGDYINEEIISVYIKNNDIEFSYSRFNPDLENFSSKSLSEVLDKVHNPSLIAKLTGYYKDKSTGVYKQSFKFNKGLTDEAFPEGLRKEAQEYGYKNLVQSSEKVKAFEKEMTDAIKELRTMHISKIPQENKFEKKGEK